MKITNQIYIPDKETYETNQSGQLTIAQKDFFKLEPEDVVIQNQKSDFIYHSGRHVYNFRNTNIDFENSYDPFIKQKSILLPGSQYEILTLTSKNEDSLFLSAKLHTPNENEDIYRTMVYNLASFFYFSFETLESNRMGQFLPKQLKKARKGLKEYDSDPSIKSFDFVFVGEKTKELCPAEANFIQHILPHFHNRENIFLFNVKYRIFYDSSKQNFLSMEPVEMVDIGFSLPYIQEYIEAAKQDEIQDKIQGKTKERGATQTKPENATIDTKKDSNNSAMILIGAFLIIMGLAGFSSRDAGCLPALFMLGAVAIFINLSKRNQNNQK